MVRPAEIDIAIIGGGAAGFFAAVTAAELAPGLSVEIFERGKEVLQKVRVSGGGRCNVTHACTDPMELIRSYPRGGKALLGPFRRFGPPETVDWFRQRGVVLKTEPDGRMFPVSDRSETVIQALTTAARRAGVVVRTSSRLTGLNPPGEPGENCWTLTINDQYIKARKVLLSTGGSPAIWDLLSGLGLAIVPPVPSLFTLRIRDQRLSGLAGISVPGARLGMVDEAMSTHGPLLITHQGLSGPAVLRQSAWGARILAGRDYRFELRVNWTGEDRESCLRAMSDFRENAPKRTLLRTAWPDLSARLWDRLVRAAGIPEDRTWSELRKEESRKLADELTDGRFAVNGKNTFKEEFVTAGGVDLREIDFRTFSARRFPGLYLAGEVLDIDAITGGYNFQAAWTGGWHAGKAMGGPR